MSKPTEACLSNLAFDRMRAGELTAVDLRDAKAHLRECTRCAQQAAMLEAETESFELPTFARCPNEGRVIRPAQWRHRTPAVIATLAALAAGAMAMFYREKDTGDTIVLKGQSSIFAYLSVADKQQLIDQRIDAHPNDHVQFAYRSLHPIYIAIASVDGAQQWSVYHDGKTMLPSTVTETPSPLAHSIRLDKTLGTETIWAAACIDAEQTAKWLRHVEQHRKPLEELSGCVFEQWTLEKKP